MTQQVQIHFDGDQTVIETSQDVGDILEHNKRLRSEGQKSDWGRHTAEIPAVILTRWLNEEWERGNVGLKLFGEEMERLIARKLRDPDWAWLRTDSKHTQSIVGYKS